MTPTSAKKVVLLALVTTAGIATVKAARSGQQPRAGIFIGTMAAGVILTGLADPAPQIAAGLAGLTVFGALAAEPETLQALADSTTVRRTTNKGSGKQVPFDLAAGPDGAIVAATATSTAPAATLTGGRDWRTPPDNLTSIGQGGHRLAAPAAAALAQAERTFGGKIWVTDSYRTYAQQAAGYASDPSRFAPPQESAHVRGLAIDVHTGRLNISNPKLLQALQSAGWCQANPNHEPWHFSFGECR
jgi:hypothetical protein